jgi:hypothetical protein
MKSMCCLCIQFIHENTSERTILHQVNNNKILGGVGGANPTRPPFQVWLLALQKRLATPLIVYTFVKAKVPQINHTHKSIFFFFSS